MKANYNSAIIRTLVRIFIVVLYYIVLIGVGLLSFYATYYLTIYAFAPLLVTAHRFWWVILVAWLGLCSFVIMFSLFLIKPLFSFHKSKAADNAKEIKKDECPLLFELIEEVASKTGNRPPKHVYLSTDVNACVFFNSSFWSIFFPVRKSLKIGLGLLPGISQEEFKAVLAHEFGHFSQKSMKIGSVIYIINQVLYNITYSKDFWDDLLDKWCKSSNTVFAIFGIMNRALINRVRVMNESMYRFLQRRYLHLSRLMEFDADNVACEMTGKENFISMLVKIDINSQAFNDHVGALAQLIAEGKRTKDVYDALYILQHLKAEIDKDEDIIEYEVSLKEPRRNKKLQSRVQITSVWATHPSLEDRIENAQDGISKQAELKKPAWGLIPNNVRTAISEQFIDALGGKKGLTIIDDTDFREWAFTYLSNNYIDPLLRPFFCRKISRFTVPENITEVENPFSENCKKAIDECMIAEYDWNLLCQLKSGEIESSGIQYDGKPVSRKKLPMTGHKKYLEDLKYQVQQIDRMVFQYLYYLCDNEQQKQLKDAYVSLFYADKMLTEEINGMIKIANRLCKELNESMELAALNEHDDTIYDVGRFVDQEKKLLSSMRLDLFSLVAEENITRAIYSFKDEPMWESNRYKNIDFLNFALVQLPQLLQEIHIRIYNYFNGQILDIVKGLNINNGQGLIDFCHIIDKEDEIKIYVERNEREETDSVIVSWILFVMYTLVIITIISLFSLVNKTPDNNSLPEAKIPEQKHETATINQNFSIIGEKTDGRIAFQVPNGLEYYYDEDKDVSYFYDDANNPSINIAVSSYDLQEVFGSNEFDEFVQSYIKNQEWANLKYTIDNDFSDSTVRGSIVKYASTIAVDTPPQFYVDIIAARSDKNKKLCIIVCERLSSSPDKLNELVKTIRLSN